MVKESFTLWVHNIAGGNDGSSMRSEKDIPTKNALDQYLDFYTNLSLPLPDTFAIVEAHAEDTPESDPSDGSATSEMVNLLSGHFGLEYTAVHTYAPSHMNANKSLATAVLSRHKITNSHSLSLPNPNLTYEISPGTIWKSFDKKVQLTELDIEGVPTEIAVFHGVPFHRFGEKLYDPTDPNKYAGYRGAVIDSLMPKSVTPRIIVGDFNNKGVDIETAFSGLFEGGFEKAVNVPTTRARFHQETQFDHVLHQQSRLRVLSSRVIHNTPSDHSLLVVQFAPQGA